MDRNVIWLLLLWVLGWIGGLEANANDQQHVVPMEKVLPDQSQQQQQQPQQQQQQQLQKYLPADEQRTEQNRDKSAVKMQKKIQQTLLPSESHQQHQQHQQHQHHLRHRRLGQLDKYQLVAWEPLQDVFLPQRRHQHKSQSQPSRTESRPNDSANVIRHATPTTATTVADDIDYSYNNNNNNRQLGAVATQTESKTLSETETEMPIVNSKLVTISNAGNGNSYPKWEEPNGNVFTASQWEKLEQKHRQQKQQREKQIQQLREHKKTKANSNKFHKYVSAAEKLLLPQTKEEEDDNNGQQHDNTDNSYTRNYIPGKFTDLKNKQLGTPEAVIHTRRRHHDPNFALANEHWNQVRKEAVCRVPQKRCVRVENDPSKQYTPHCVQLHRCAEDSGCCDDRGHICAPKEVQEVVKVFHVKKQKSRHSVTENLTFVNHTECHCIERNNFDAEAVITAVEIKQVTIGSKCPTLFEKILQNDGQFRCDCSSSNYHCDLFKRGGEHFSLSNRICISQGVCKLPTCQFGKYMEKHGRCPNQNEQAPQHQATYNTISMS